MLDSLGLAIMKWARLVVVSLGLLQGVQSQTNATIRLGMMVTPPPAGPPAKFHSLFPEITGGRPVPHKVADYSVYDNLGGSCPLGDVRGYVWDGSHGSIPLSTPIHQRGPRAVPR